jgi:type VI secretion system secreted protein VgrG
VGHVTCLSTRADLPLNAFIGLLLSVQMGTDRGALHRICANVVHGAAQAFG